MEDINLVLNAAHHEVTRAEAIKTCAITDMSLQYVVKLFQAVPAKEAWPKESARVRVDKRDFSRRRAALDCPFWTVYGARGRRPEVHHLSAYEFARHYHMELAKHPLSIKAHDQHVLDPNLFHAQLTEHGLAKLRPGRAEQNPQKKQGFNRYKARKTFRKPGWVGLMIVGG